MTSVTFSSNFGTSALTTSGGITAADLYDEEYLENKYSYKETQESYEIAYEGQDAVIETYISNILSYISNGEEDKAMEAYEELLDAMSDQTRYAQLISDDGDDTQLRAIARELIEADLGSDLEEYITDNTKNGAAVKAQKIRTAGNCDSTSTEDLLNAMCNMDEEEGTNVFSIIGSIIVSPITATLGNLVRGFKKAK